MSRKYPSPEIEDVQEAFCGCRRKNMVPLVDANHAVAAEWCYKRNCGWGPEDFSCSSSVKAWFTCPQCARDYKAIIDNRTRLGSGCPYCASKLVCEDNSLAAVHPELVSQWDVRKNGKLKPTEVCYSSMQQVFWRCSAGSDHRWQAAISTRTRAVGGGCPFCAGLRVSVTNSLATQCPEIAAQWHPTKNKNLTPEDVVVHSNKRVWWLAECGHSWQADINSRTARMSGCYKCRFGEKAQPALAGRSSGKFRSG